MLTPNEVSHQKVLTYSANLALSGINISVGGKSVSLCLI